MRTHVVVPCIAALLGLQATAAAQQTNPMAGHAGHAGMPAGTSTAMQMASGTGITALLTGPMGTRSPSGAATVEGTAVRVTWSGDQPGATRPWYVHKGSCSHDEGMVGAASAYTPITVDAMGAGSGAATLPGPLDPSTTYFVAVHASPSSATSEVIACGPLGGGSMGMGQMAGMSGMSGMSGAGDTSNVYAMMAIQMRMMADPVIRQRVMTDPTLRRMMQDMMKNVMSDMMSGMATGGGTPAMQMPMPMSGDSSHAAHAGASAPAQPSAAAAASQRVTKDAAAGHDMSMPGMAGHNMPGMARSSGSAAARTPAKAAPAKQPAARKPAQATTARKPAPTPAKKDSMAGMDMKGMDHSKMPGMRKQP